MDIELSGATAGPELQKSLQFHAAAREKERIGDKQKAVLFYQAAINTCPLNGAPYVGLLELLLALKEYGSARKIADKVPAALYQQNDQLRVLHGVALVESGAPEQAIVIFEPLVGNPKLNQGVVLNNLGTCYHRLEQLENAAECYEKAEAAGLRDVPMFWNLAGIYLKLDQLEKAEKVYRRGLSQYPDNADLLYEYAIFLLKATRFTEGFQYYCHRFGAQGFGMHKVNLPVPEWQGEGRPRRILVALEQGVGDQVVFAALLPAFIKNFEQVAVSADDRLLPILRRSFPAIEFVSNKLSIQSEFVRDFDAFVHAGDIGRFVKGPMGYREFNLRADPDKTNAIRKRYREMFPGKTLVGISWRSKRELFGELKTVTLDNWSDILRDDSIQFVNCQYGDVDQDLLQVQQDFGVSIFNDPEIDAFNDFEGIAAQANALDLVLTTSNSNAHLAAATGAKTWLIAPRGSGLLWYWGTAGSSCVWYPSVRIFRASQTRVWGEVMCEVKRELGMLLEDINDG